MPWAKPAPAGGEGVGGCVGGRTSERRLRAFATRQESKEPPCAALCTKLRPAPCTLLCKTHPARWAG